MNQSLSEYFATAYAHACLEGTFRRYQISSPWHYGNDVLSLDKWDEKRRSFKAQKATSVTELFSDMDECKWWLHEYIGERFDREIPWIVDGPWDNFLKETEIVFHFSHEYRREIERQKATNPSRKID